MQIQHLIYFIEVARMGSINRAAEKLFISQPSLSKSILGLERELKVELLERTKRGVILTAAGRKLLLHAETIVRQMDLIAELAEREENGLLSIVTASLPIMGDVVSDFSEHCAKKGVSVAVQVEEERLSNILDWVAEYRADMGIALINSMQENSVRKMIREKKLEYRLIGTDQWCVNVGPKNPLYERREVSMEELRDYSCVKKQEDYFSRLAAYLTIDGVSLNELKGMICVSDTAMIRAIVRKTDAYCFALKSGAEEDENYGVRSISVKNCPDELKIWLIKRKNEGLSDVERDFSQIFKMRLRERGRGNNTEE